MDDHPPDRPDDRDGVPRLKPRWHDCLDCDPDCCDLLEFLPDCHVPDCDLPDCDIPDCDVGCDL